MQEKINTGKKKLLIVDDNMLFARELKDALDSCGYDAVAMDDITRVTEFARIILPDAVMLDLKMPQKSGFQIADELKEAPESVGIPLIAMSAEYKDGELGIMEVHGFKRFLKKPFSIDEAVSKIEEVIKLREIGNQ